MKSVLYKYFPSNRNFFEDLTIRFSQRAALHDPFELLPSESSYRAYLNSIDDFDESEWEAPTLNPFFDQFGILSLTEDKRNLTMWSHYSEDHKGYVVGFDIKHEFFNQPRKQLEIDVKEVHKVVYSDYREEVPSNPTEWFLHKSNAWIYEKEHRVIRRLLEARTVFDLKDGKEVDVTRGPVQNYLQEYRKRFRDPRYLFLFDVPKDAIVSVTFGAKMDGDLEGNIKASIADKFKNTSFKIENASISADRFEIDIN